MALLLGHQTIISQTYNIEYYKLKKVRVKNVTTTVSDDYGIFTTRVKQVCYDSRSDGSMNYRSNLKYEKQANGLTFYKGKCYLDDFCHYVFNDSKGILNVTLSNGDVYVYHKVSSPIGRTEGRYYSKSQGGGGGAAGVYAPATSTTPSKNVNNRRSASTKETQICDYCGGRGKCNNYSSSIGHRGHCNGSGRCETCGGDGYSGLMNNAKCSVCNNTGRCSRCGGSGLCRKCGGTGRL